MRDPITSPTLPALNPAELRHRVTLLTQVVSTDMSGATVTYQAANPPITCYGKLEYMRGAEVIKSGIDATQAYIKITSYYRPDFTAKSRVQLSSGSQLIIQYVENVREMNTVMVLTCLGVGAENDQ